MIVKVEKKSALVITIWSCEVNGYCKVYLSSEKKPDTSKSEQKLRKNVVILFPI